MITPTHSPIQNISIDVSASGDNVLVPLVVPAFGIKLARTYIHNIKIFPRGDVNMIIKAVNTVTLAERILDAGSNVTDKQPFIFENTSPDSVYLWELLPDEELVMELDAAVQCTGFVGASYSA
jgi:hypothetical protein